MKGGYLYCEVCWKYASEAHVESKRHRDRMKHADYYLNDGQDTSPGVGPATSSSVQEAYLAVPSGAVSVSMPLMDATGSSTDTAITQPINAWQRSMFIAELDQLHACQTMEREGVYHRHCEDCSPIIRDTAVEQLRIELAELEAKHFQELAWLEWLQGEQVRLLERHAS